MLGSMLKRVPLSKTDNGALYEELKKDLERSRELNDDELSWDDTQAIRGRIRVVRELLSFFEPPSDLDKVIGSEGVSGEIGADVDILEDTSNG